MKRELAALTALAAIAVAVFAPTFAGEFVYDDRKQIVDNHLIQEPRLLGRALVSDVWAFKGDREESWSNYWRPTFTAWLAGCHRLFGVDSAFGWRVANALLHALAVALAFLTLRRLELSFAASAAVALLFAVHPVHVESVAWVSGSPDLLLAAALLGSLLLLIPARRGEPLRPRALAGALLLYALALGAKEAAVAFPAIVIVVALAAPTFEDVSSRRERLLRAARLAAPFVALAALYLGLRHVVLERMEVPVPWLRGPFELLANVPRLLGFYLRQVFWPAEIGPSYPLRALTAGETVGGLLVPLAIEAALVAALLLLGRRDRRVWIGATLFLAPLLPAMNLNAFVPEQVVHDRYLYLPLLGALLVAMSALRAARLSGPGSKRPPASEALVFAFAALAALPLGAQTVRYGQAWTSELALWERAVETDPTSAFNLAEYGRALQESGRTVEAEAVVERALAITPATTALLVRADLRRERGELEAAAADLVRILAAQPAEPRAFQRLADVRLKQGRLDEAAALLRLARERIPYRSCSFTSDLGVVLYLSGRKNEALAELESVRNGFAVEPVAGCARALFHLGALYAESGRPSDASVAFSQFLAASVRFRDPTTSALRVRVEAARGRPPG